ncbi:MAG: hypothetical protein JKP98_15195 [Rhodobacteraceae bacterium]|nr:hypothetical protein [Paracoccaceae bacterium]
MTAHRVEIVDADATAEALTLPRGALILCGALPPIHGGCPLDSAVEAAQDGMPADDRFTWFDTARGLP